MHAAPSARPLLDEVVLEEEVVLAEVVLEEEVVLDEVAAPCPPVPELAWELLLVVVLPGPELLVEPEVGLETPPPPPEPAGPSPPVLRPQAPTAATKITPTSRSTREWSMKHPLASGRRCQLPSAPAAAMNAAVSSLIFRAARCSAGASASSGASGSHTSK